MAIQVGDYSFCGPFKHLKMIDERPGIFAVHYYQTGNYYLLDLGHASSLQIGLREHPRETEWGRFGRGVLTFAVMYTDSENEEAREKIVRALRHEYEPACGRVI